MQTVAAEAAKLKVAVPALAREPCQAAPLPQGRSPGETDYQVFGIRQTTKLELCDGKRALGVEAADLHNRYVDQLVDELKPRSWWRRLLPF